MLKLDDYQEELIQKAAQKLVTLQSIIVQATTGSGKTVIFSEICNRFITKTQKKVIIFIHKSELLDQTRRTLHDWHGIVSQTIDANTKYILPDARVFVAMVETFNNRTESHTFLERFKDVGLCIVDECHIGNFKKILMHFVHAKRLGFTATPVAATKKDPLNKYYQDIVIGPKTSTLIELNRQNPDRGVVPVVTYSLIGNIDRDSLKSKGDDFDEDSMGEEFSKKQQIQNTVDAYLRHSYGKKTLCFNANIKHSLLVHEAFLANGLNSRHLDASKKCSDTYRKDCFEWLKHTPNAILNNVGIATTGLDERSIETVIVNKSTKSIPLWNQMGGRGARTYRYSDGTYKDHFIHIDMGDNVVGGNLGQWSDDIPWEDYFWNPKIPKPGVAPVKICPSCGAINVAAARYCPALEIDWLTDQEKECGYIFPISDKEIDEQYRELVLITSSKIDVRANIEFFKDRKEYFAMHQTYLQVCNLFKNEFTSPSLDSMQLDYIIEAGYIKVSEWFRIVGKKRWPGLKDVVRNSMIDELRRLGFTIQGSEVAEMK